MKLCTTVFLCLATLVVPMNAQTAPDLEEGIKPYASLHGGALDSVDLVNGNLMLHIPLLSYPQKGTLRLDFMLRVNNKNWVLFPWQPNHTCPPQTGSGGSCVPTFTNAYWVWQGTGLGVTWNGDYHCTAGNYDYTDANPVTIPDVITDPSGAVHTVAFLNAPGTANIEETTDGSGIRAFEGDLRSECGTVTDRNGIKYTQSAVTDPSGNAITGNSTSGWTDSVGRQIPGGDAVTFVPPIPKTPGNPLPFSSNWIPGNIMQGTGGCPSGTAYARAWNTPAYGGSAQYIFCMSHVALQTAFAQTYPDPYYQTPLHTVIEYSGTKDMLTAIVLPNNQMWSFTYDSYGDLLRLGLPTGGSITYGWQTTFDSVTSSRILVSRTINANDGTGEHQWNYDYSSRTGATLVTGPAPENNVTEHDFTLFGGCCNRVSPYETATKWYQGNSSAGQLLKTVSTHYIDNTDPAGVLPVVIPDKITTSYPGIAAASESLGNIFMTAQINWSYAGAGVVQVPVTTSSTVALTDFGGSFAVRTTTTTPLWQVDPTYFAANMLDLPSNRVVTDQNGVQVARTDYTYDESSYSPSGKNGLLTTQRDWLNGGQSPQTHTGWNSSGMESYTIDAQGNVNGNGHTLDFSYNQCAGSLLSDSYNALGHHTSAGYDCNSGLVTSLTDPNAQTLTYTYDSLGRLTRESFPDQGWTTFTYDDSGNTVTRTKALNASSSEQYKVSFDGFGREIRNELLTDPQGDSSVETSYDNNGNVLSKTTPHRVGTSSTDGTSTFHVDALGRQVAVVQPDGSTRRWCYGGMNSLISSGNCVMAGAGAVNTFWTDTTDEAGNTWRRSLDALGNLRQVIEPLALVTNYSYDPLDHLTAVAQPGQAGESARARSFTYDSLSRLVTAANPETGTVTYNYDLDGNLHQKIDARGMWVLYAYDPLNRLTDKSFNDGQTPNQHFRYDQTSVWMGPQHNTIGRLSQAATDPDMRGSGVGCSAQSQNLTNANAISGYPVRCEWTDELYSYDSMGRLQRNRSAAPSEAGWNAHEIDMAYDLAGDMTSLLYPDGRTITQKWDGAGRLQNVTYDNWNGQHVGSSYASGFTYTPAGAQTEVTMGNGVYTHQPYNSRQQICQLWIVNGQQVLTDRHYSYANGAGFCANTPSNSGNLAQIVDILNNNRSQGFSYDGLNRLNAFSNGDGSMQQSYVIDSFGNLKQSGTFSPQASFDANNRINTGAYGYDAAGNINTYNNGLYTATYAFDAESKLYTLNSGGGYYTYDAQGERMRKDSGGGFTEYQYLNGVPIAEKKNDGTWSDYIYANGTRIARADSFDNWIHLHGTMTATGNAAGWNLPFSNYTVNVGDAISWRQLQFGGAQGGIGIRFTDGTYSNWVTKDTDGQVMNSDTRSGAWFYRTVDLSPFGGKTIAALWLNADVQTAAGTWDSYFDNIVVYGRNGTVLPIYTGETFIGLGYFGSAGATGTWANVGQISNISSPGWVPGDVVYYHGDQLGSTQVLTADGGWPLVSETYYPFGQEQSASAGPNHYRFTGKERDAESGLDYFGARYYASNMGRWMSPDWADKPEAVPYSSLRNPQSLNLYGYVLNNPVSHVDPDGHCCDWKAVEDYTLGVFRGAVSSLTYGHTGAPSSSDSASSLAGQFFGTSVVAGVGASAVSSSGPTALAGLAAGPETAGASLVVSGGAVAAGVMGASAVAGAAGNSGAIAVAMGQGSYTNIHESGRTYSGKGDEARAQASGKRVEKATGDKHTATDHTPSADDRQSFKDESQRIDSNGGVGSSANHNKIESPGKKYIQQDRSQ